MRFFITSLWTSLGLALASTGCQLGAGPMSRFQSTTGACPVSHIGATATSAFGIAAAPATAGGNELAQSFVTAGTFKAGRVRLKLTRAGQPGGILSVALQGSSGAGTNAQPDGVSLASGSLLVTSPTPQTGNITPNPEGAFVEFKLSSAVELKASTRYWVVVGASYSLSDTDVVKWIAGQGDPDSSGFGLEETAVPSSWRSIPLQDFRYQVCEG